MDANTTVKYKKRLLEDRQRLINKGLKNLEDIRTDVDDLPDETDLAASEINQNLAFKLRDRERAMLAKIDMALEKMDDGTFGTCEDCEEPIETARLEVQPTSSFCLSCQERHEHKEKVFA